MNRIRNSKTKDFNNTVSNAIVKDTLHMAWPAVCESFFVSLAGMIDSLMVSTMGSYAVAAVGLTTQPKFMGLSVFIAVNVAVSALVARRRGEKKKDEANRILLTRRGRKGGTYGVYHPVERSKQPGKECAGICNPRVRGQLQGHECSGA